MFKLGCDVARCFPYLDAALEVALNENLDTAVLDAVGDVVARVRGCGMIEWPVPALSAAESDELALLRNSICRRTSDDTPRTG